MSVPFRSHTLTVNLPSEVIEDNVLNGYGDSPQGTVEGVLYAVDSGTMQDRFDVSTKRGWAFLCDVPDAVKFEEGGSVTGHGKTFTVKGSPLVIESGGSADNAEVPLEQVD